MIDDEYVVPVDKIIRFKLSSSFLDEYKERDVEWGYGVLSYITYKRTYAREVEGENRTEEWWETCARVIEGMFTIQKAHCKTMGLPWDNRKAQRSAQEAYERLFTFKWTPPGRGLWCMGTEFVYKRGGAALNNCAFVSTENISTELAEPFVWNFIMSMYGVGVGFDTKGAGTVTIVEPRQGDDVHVVGDSREGWADAIRRSINAYSGIGSLPLEWDFSEVRKKGEPIKGFGGVASGPDPLEKALRQIAEVFSARVDQKILESDIVDIMNICGACVVAGGIRRCLKKGTGVLTSKGIKPIEEVEIGDSVATAKGYKKVLDSLYQGRQGLVKINHQDGWLECTPDHRVAILQDTSGNYIWKQASDLEPGDRLMYVRTLSEGQTTLPAWEYDRPENSTTSVDIQIPDLTEDVAYLFGMIAGDGYVYLNDSQTKGRVVIAVHSDQIDIAEKVKNTLKKFGVNTKINKNMDGNYVRVEAFSNQLAQYMSQFKEPNKTIRIPEFIMLGTPQIKMAYVAGLIDSDGCLLDRPKNVVTTVYPEFAKDVQNILYSLGIESRINESNEDWESRKGWQKQYKVALISMYSQNRIMESCKTFKKVDGEPKKSQYSNGFPREMITEYTRGWSRQSVQMTTDTYARLFDSSNKIVPIEVISVEESGESDTYDLSVEGEHCFIADGVLVHNTAQIAFGKTEEFMDLKLDKEKVQEWRWASNNSIFAELGQDYSHAASRTAVNGEPGYAWLENMRKFGRMKDGTNWKDYRVAGGNPCLEQSLEDHELCCLVESYPAKHEDFEDYKRTLKFAYMYAKTVTLVPTHDKLTNAVMMRNRRIGCSMSGIIQNIELRGLYEHLRWCDEGYTEVQKWDKTYSEWLCIPWSIKTTSVKPSGTVSLLAGATPGIHAAHAQYIIRRVRIAETSMLWRHCEAAGYHVEKDIYSDNTMVVEFPIYDPLSKRCKSDFTIWEQVNLAAQHQHYWADNQVSCTVNFEEHEKDQIELVLEAYQDRLKGISFLPMVDHGYDQAPYEEITKEKYHEIIDNIDLQYDFNSANIKHDKEDKFCDGEACEINLGG